MAVCAEQDALLGLLTSARERSRHTSIAHREPLVRRDDVVELESRNATVVAADSTGSARFLDKDPLDSPPTTRDGIRIAPYAPVPARRAQAKRRSAMLRAAQRHLASAISRSLAPLGPYGLQSVLLKPVTNARLAAVQGLGDLSDRHTRLNQRRQLGLRQPTLGRMPRVPDGLKIMSLQPVRDRRFMPVKAPPDLGERESLLEQTLQRLAIHAPYCLQRLGHNRRASQSSTPAPPSPPTRARKRDRTAA
jgi:hypothetical protein